MATSTAAPMDALGFPEALAAQLARRSKGDFESAIAGRPVSEDQLTDARAITVIFLSRRGRKALETSCEKSAVERLAAMVFIQPAVALVHGPFDVARNGRGDGGTAQQVGEDLAFPEAEERCLVLVRTDPQPVQFDQDTAQVGAAIE